MLTNMFLLPFRVWMPGAVIVAMCRIRSVHTHQIML